jgi:hypothetical protein
MVILITSMAQIDAVVTTPDGYDNFNMGFTAFAEVHMSMNPNNPLYVFAGFNSSGTVGTVPFVTKWRFNMGICYSTMGSNNVW